ncbi:MAG TPA: hypothetical protein VHC43_02735 [Mycobacteriales bacterium]|nr:hypothetical protein [Mycobacteriales bacterium]
MAERGWRRWLRPTEIVDATVKSVDKGANLIYGTVVGENRIPLTLALVAAIALQLLLPRSIVIIHERWLLPAFQIALLIALIISNPFRITRESPLIRTLGLVMLGAIAFNDIVGIVRMVDLLLNGHKAKAAAALTGQDLIRVAVVVWLTNVIVFALAFFELDQGGPFKRLSGEGRADFLFPQQTDDLREKWPNWRPTFIDYLFLSFTNSTAFSPTDTMPLSSWAKMLMLLQSGSALVTIGVVAARAVNILGGPGT